MHFRGIRSLRIKIILWAFVPAVIILAAVALLTNLAYLQVTEELVIGRDRELAYLSAAQLRDDLSAFTTALMSLPQAGDLFRSGPTIQRQILQNQKNRLGIFDAGVVLLDQAGRVIGADPERPEALGQDWSGRDYYRQILYTRKPALSNLLPDGPRGTEVVVVAVPVTGEREELLGILAGMFRTGTQGPSLFYDQIAQIPLANGSSLYLVDGTGRLIYQSGAGDREQNLSGQPAFSQALLGKVGAFRTQGVDGQEVVAAYAPVPGTSWAVVLQDDWAALTRTSQRYGQFLLLLLLAGMFVPALVVAFGVHRIIQPIRELIGAAQQVAAGNFGQVIHSPTGDEVEELAEQFNQMSIQLKDSYSNLEHRVASRTRELATLNTIASVVSRSLDLGEIMDAALGVVLDVMEMDAGWIYQLDEKKEALVLVSKQGPGLEYIPHLDELPLDGTAMALAVSQQEPVALTVDGNTGDLFAGMLEWEHLPFVIAFPLFAKGRSLGAACLAAKARHSLTPEERSLLRSIGQQIGVALENARLYAETQRRLAESESLQQVTRALLQKLRLEEVLQIVCTQTLSLTGAQGSAVFLLDEDGLQMRRAFSLGDPPPHLESLPADRFDHTGLSDRVDNDRIEDAAGADGLRRPVASEVQPAVLSIPLCINDVVIGALNAVNKAGGFKEEDRRIIRLFADQAAIAIESARLSRQAEQLAVIEERHRLARELHDSVTQQLYGLALFTEMARRSITSGDLASTDHYLLRQAETVEQAHKEMRLLIYELRPPAVEQEGLIAALQRRLNSVERRAGVKARLSAGGSTPLPPAVEDALYKITIQALNNSLKHAQASSVEVRLSFENSSVFLEVEDNGRGLDLETALAAGGLGLTSMRERTEKLGGQFNIVSSIGKGTRIEVSIDCAHHTAGKTVSREGP